MRKFGGRVEMTGEHPSGTDRIAEVVRRTCKDAEIIVNIQGDEPEIDPSHIDLLVKTLAERPKVEMSTLATPIRNRRELDDHSCNKVVCADDGRRFISAGRPFPTCGTPSGTNCSRRIRRWLLHLGLYAYRVDFLLKLSCLPPSRLERLEKLEQLRVLEMGANIQVAVVEQRSVGIDTPEDYARFVERMRNRPTA